MHKPLHAISFLILLAGIILPAAAVDTADFEPIDSKIFESIKYDGSHLFLKFRDGRIVRHDDVPGSLVERFKKHRLKGGFYKGSIASAYEVEILRMSDTELELLAEEKAKAGETDETEAGEPPMK